MTEATRFPTGNLCVPASEQEDTLFRLVGDLCLYSKESNDAVAHHHQQRFVVLFQRLLCALVVQDDKVKVEKILVGLAEIQERNMPDEEKQSLCFLSLCEITQKEINWNGIQITHEGVSRRGNSTPYLPPSNFRLTRSPHLWGSKKFRMVVDLDHTIIHTARSDEFRLPDPPPPGRQCVDDSDHRYDDVIEFAVPNDPLPYFGHFRPGYMEFLLRSAEHFEMHLFSFGRGPYVETVLEMMGSLSTLFRSVTSLDDWPLGSQAGKNLHHLFPESAYSMPTVIVDDNKRNVWRHERDQRSLIDVIPYRFFYKRRRRRGRGKSPDDGLNGLADVALQRGIHLERVMGEKDQFVPVDMASTSNGTVEVSAAVEMTSNGTTGTVEASEQSDET
eukprot:TRINITY_DN7555_c0_g1_i1.p1 TRINITY_DN7555_c0_g1~~TRINITY_DN7555_c0_g1_i1.p1  ORF type:complete len:388 (+),score=74.57 TRINITY_DN7555_c0_g1_i1:154-1317(+)